MEVVQDALVNAVEITGKFFQCLLDIAWTASAQRTELKLNPEKPVAFLASKLLSS
jgi:hypothetical protein